MLARLTPLDWGLLGVLAISTVVGVWRGLVFELASLLGWVLAWWMAHQYGAWVGQTLPMTGTAPMWREMAGFVIVFVLTLLTCALAARLLRLLVSVTPLTIIDRMLGALFGLVRGLLLLLVLALVINWSPLKRAGWWQGSQGATWLTDWEQALVRLLPDPIRRPLGA